jgi:molybdopterin-binding protein
MQVSARNALKGTVKKVVPGTVNSEITIEVAPGVEVTSIITKVSAENLKITEGSQVYAVIKATDVIIATD